MGLKALETHLQQSFQASAASRLDAVFRINIKDQSLAFRVSRGTLDFDLPRDVSADATFMFEDMDTAWALLSGRADAFEAFMEGRFRSDGYLMWAFALMAMFQSSSLPETPTE
jgi:putative sterol carrier protein